MQSENLSVRLLHEHGSTGQQHNASVKRQLHNHWLDSHIGPFYVQETLQAASETCGCQLTPR